jgi:hypothetical protein
MFLLYFLTFILRFRIIVLSLTEVLHYASYGWVFIPDRSTYLTFFSITFIWLITILIHPITIRIKISFMFFLLTVVKHFHQVHVNISRYSTNTSSLHSDIRWRLHSTSRLAHTIGHSVVTAVRLNRFLIFHANATHARFS